MKKKIILTVLLVLCIVFAFIIGVAYGNNKKEDPGSTTVKDSKKDKTESYTKINSKKWEPNLVTINGKKYDLSEDIQKVIGAMTKDGIEVYEPGGGYRLYDENGRKIRGSGGLMNMNENYWFAAEEWNQTDGLISIYDNLDSFSEEHGYFISKRYYFKPEDGINFVSGLGISSAKDIEKMANQKILIETDFGMLRFDNHGYTAVFVNGKPLVFSSYEDDLEELKNAPAATEYPHQILLRFFPHYRAFSHLRLNYDYYLTYLTYNELQKHYSENNYSTLDEELLIYFAMEDAYQQLEAGKVESIILVSFDLNEEKEFVGMYYNEYYFDVDRTWTPDKFGPVN